MLYLVTGLVILGFVVSFYHDRRKLSNAFLFVLSLGLLFMSLTQFVYDHQMERFHLFLMAFLYGLVPIGLLLFAILMILNGFVVLKKEGKRLANSLSILFGLAILTYVLITVGYYRYFAGVYSTYTNLGQIIHYAYLMLSFVVIVLSFIFCSFLAYSLLYLSLPKQKDYDYIIIHGSGLIDGYIVPPLLASRIDKAIEAYEQADKPDVRLIASGGQGSDERISEARAIADYLMAKGISEECILLEDKSTTTYDNLRYSHALARQEKATPKYLFVSNNYHVFRATLYAKRLGMVGEGVGAKTAGYYIPSAFLREYIAILNKLKWVLLAATLAFVFLIYLSQ